MPRRPRLGRVGAGCTDRMGDVVTDLVRLREVPHVFTPITSSSTGLTVALVSPTRACSGGEVQSSGISFRYQEDGPLVLDDVSIRIPAGSSVALVGPSGSGVIPL